MPYNSNYTGASIEEILAKVIDAQPATESAAGKGGLIPAPPVGSQDGNKVLKSNLTWGEAGGVPEALDLSMFDAESGTLTQEQFDSIQNAFDKKIHICTIGDIVIPIVIISSDGYFFISGFFATIYSDASALIAIYLFRINSDKTYTKATSEYLLPDETVSHVRFMTDEPTVVNTLVNIPSYTHSVIANVSAATDLSVMSSLKPGHDLQIRVNNTTSSVITQPIPTTGQYECLDGTSVEIPANGFIELNIWHIDGKYVIRVGQKQ